MKRYLVAILFLFGTILFSHAQKSGNTWTEMGLMGKVKYMETCEYLPVKKNGKIIKGKMVMDDWTHFDTHYFFDKSGKLLKKEDYQDKHLLFYVTTYAYGEDGKLLRKETQAPVKNRSSYTIFSYDKAGNEVGINIYFSDSTTETYYKGFDFDGNCRYAEYYIDSIRYEKSIYTYNKKNQLVESQLFFGAWNETAEITRFVYDNNGHLIETWCGGPQPSHYIYIYNEKGQKMEVHSLNDLEGGKEGSVITYEYDAQGSITLQLTKFPNFQVKESTTYTYDKKKNWVKKIVFKDDQPVTIVERKIKYY